MSGEHNRQVDESDIVTPAGDKQRDGLRVSIRSIKLEKVSS